MNEHGSVSDPMITYTFAQADGPLYGVVVASANHDRSVARMEPAHPFMTEQETQILSLVARGSSDIKIGAALGITTDQVDYALRQIRAEFSRGDFITTTEAVIRALEARLLNVRKLVSRRFNATVFYKLTENEATAVRLLSTGKTNEELAFELGISVPAVKQKLNNVYGKINAKDRNMAIVRYLEASRRAKERAKREGIVNTDDIDAFYYKPFDPLTPMQRKYMDMRSQGVPTADIAVAFGISTQSVKNAISEGRKRLRQTASENSKPPIK